MTTHEDIRSRRAAEAWSTRMRLLFAIADECGGGHELLEELAGADEIIAECEAILAEYWEPIAA
jgi:hypothetical protein